MKTKTNLTQRVCHAALYELCAILILVPAGAWLMNEPLGHLGLLGIMMSLQAMSWNMLFNAIFERLERRYRWQRTPWVRSLHAIAFEGGLLFISLPLVAWWMEMSLWQALLLDGGLLLFFLPYTYIFNWCYDHARQWWQGRTMVFDR